MRACFSCVRTMWTGQTLGPGKFSAQLAGTCGTQLDVWQSSLRRVKVNLGCGGPVCMCVRRLRRALFAQVSLRTMHAGLKVIELGAGCGWLGLTVAKNIPTASVCLTEMEEGGALEHLEYNVDLNSVENVRTAACDWSLWQCGDETARIGTAQEREGETGERSVGDEETGNAQSQGREGTRNAVDFDMVSRTRWDLVIGSDLIYNDIGVKWLPRVLNDLIGAEGVAYYCHTKNRLPMADVDFLAELADLRLECKEVGHA
jgi:predicted nicotinamide N-methyase